MGAWRGPHSTEKTQNGDSQGSEAAHTFNRKEAWPAGLWELRPARVLKIPGKGYAEGLGTP